jgi:hypothetical protein
MLASRVHFECSALVGAVEVLLPTVPCLLRAVDGAHHAALLFVILVVMRRLPVPSLLPCMARGSTSLFLDYTLLHKSLDKTSHIGK